MLTAMPDKLNFAIHVDAVSKVYRHYAQPIDRLREFVTGRRLHVDRHSVSDLSFNISQGEVVGIIGQNGAGKSTLLKMIAGRLEPSSGHVVVNGSVAAILELGSGFPPRSIRSRKHSYRRPLHGSDQATDRT